MKKRLKGWVPVFLMILLGPLLFSCVSQSRIKYLQDQEGAKPQNQFESNYQEYRVQPGDYLYIRLFTMDKDANEIFSQMSGVANTNSVYEQSIYLSSYLVNDSGYINFPLLGKVQAGGLLIPEIEKELQNLMMREVNNPGVVVRLVNFKISILGEVKAPGTYSITQNKITIFQALSMAGDLTTYSNRNNVKLLRKMGSNTIMINLDLTKRDILTSEYFYLRPGDIIYVEPLKNKQYAFESFPYALILSSLSTLLALLTFFRI